MNPLDAPGSHMTRRDDPERKAMVRGKGLPIHLVRQNHIAARIDGFSQRDRCTVGFRAYELHVLQLVRRIGDVETGVREDVPQAWTRPLRVADRAGVPLHAVGVPGALAHVGTPVAGALEGGGDFVLLEVGSEVGHGVFFFFAVVELDDEFVLCFYEPGNPEMVPDVEDVNWCDESGKEWCWRLGIHGLVGVDDEPLVSFWVLVKRIVDAVKGHLSIYQVLRIDVANEKAF